ncbi:hypothetical protein C8Q76DRAFT_102124 [Earliella scabrosa]|nr:hypothetical protein C8Q76DRAFT_102124 [Earliella scabrosa]
MSMWMSTRARARRFLACFASHSSVLSLRCCSRSPYIGFSSAGSFWRHDWYCSFLPMVFSLNVLCLSLIRHYPRSCCLFVQSSLDPLTDTCSQLFSLSTHSRSLTVTCPIAILRHNTLLIFIPMLPSLVPRAWLGGSTDLAIHMHALKQNQAVVGRRGGGDVHDRSGVVLMYIGGERLQWRGDDD